MAAILGGTKSCLTCRRCDTAGYPFSRIFEPLRHASIYPAGSTIFSEGYGPSAIYIVCQGSAKITLTSKTGKTLVLRTCGPGSVIGLAEVLSKIPSQTRGTTLTTSEISHVPAAEFGTVLQRDPSALAAVARVLAEELCHVRGRMAAVCLIPAVRERFLDFLRNLTATGRQTPRGVEIPFPYTHNYLAECLGCARETIARILKEFTGAGAMKRVGATLILSSRFEARVRGKTRQ